MEWAIYHFLSSAAFPHYNCRAEVGVKTVKPLLTNNTDPHGSLNINAFERAIIQYFITQDPTTKQSHVQSIFEQCIKDFIPISPGHHYKPHPTTINLTQPATEEALRNRHMQEAERFGRARQEAPTFCGWEQCTNPESDWSTRNTMGCDRYAVPIDRSGKCTTHNQKFLTKVIQYRRHQDRPSLTTSNSWPHQNQSSELSCCSVYS